jgi:hypothetical protein
LSPNPAKNQARSAQEPFIWTQSTRTKCLSFTPEWILMFGLSPPLYTVAAGSKRGLCVHMKYLDLPSPFKIFSSLSPSKKLFAKENAQFESLAARATAYSSSPPKPPATSQPKEMSTSNKANAIKCGPLAAFAHETRTQLPSQKG